MDRILGAIIGGVTTLAGVYIMNMKLTIQLDYEK